MLVSAAAEHAHAADRFAREIGAISAIVCGALAAADAQSVGWPAGVVVGVSAWPFRRCALSPLPRPPHRAAYKLALVSPVYTVGGAGRPTRHSS